MIFRPVLACCSTVRICTVSDTLPALQRLPPVQSARRGLSGIGCRPVQRLGVCGLPCYLCRVEVPGALGAPGGIIGGNRGCRGKRGKKGGEDWYTMIPTHTIRINWYDSYRLVCNNRIYFVSHIPISSQSVLRLDDSFSNSDLTVSP
jgi:hypothetical protein